jgi:predicted lipoprotein with Yx(FWY)xxD motif
MPVRSLWTAASSALFMVLVVACGGSGSSSSPAAPAATPTPTPTPVVKAVSAMVDGKSQTILADAQGLTLYYFTPDKGGKVTCTAGCLAVWPPLLLPTGVTTPVGGSGVTGTLSTIANPDGKGTQIMYNNWPLYYYAKDKNPGDTTGQNVGQKWFVVPPDLAKG